MRKYNSLLKEKRKREYKAWINPHAGTIYQFSTNGIHSEEAEKKWGMNEEEALKSGLYRVFSGHEVDIDSWELPTEREFMTTRYLIEENSYKKFDSTRWDCYTTKGLWFFKKLSFLFANKIEDGELKTFR